MLFVHGEPQVRSALARLIRAEGFPTVVAASCEEALALAQGDSFSVVITELDGVGMGGLALLQRLSPALPKARFLVLAGTGSIATELLPRGHGIRVFFKPWHQQELLAAVCESDESPISVIPPCDVAEARVTRVLLIEDDASDALLFETGLRLRHPGEFAVTRVSDMASAETLLRREMFDSMTLDLGLPDVRGLAAVARLHAAAPQIGFIVLSDSEDAELAIQSIQAGAQDYLVKRRASGFQIAKALRHAEERKRVERRLVELALHDQLTGLANRTLFRQCVARALANCRRRGGAFAVLLLDVDRFKAVNDSLGHDAGDAFLQQVAERLRKATRETDTVARFGGDEFAVLATEIAGAVDVGPILERVQVALKEPLELGGTRLIPSASIGAAVYPASGEDSDTLLAAADAAMYVAKSRGRSGHHVHGIELSRQVARRLELERRLRGAIERGEFRLHYQPQVSLSGDLFGAEALLRWSPAPGKAVNAKKFISVLEDTGQLLELGPWIIRTACEQVKAWREQGLNIARIGINLSPRQLLGRDFGKQLRDAVESAGLRPKDLELELTEATFQRQTDSQRRMLAGLHRDGFRLALDDFGTGSCSVAHLENFPIDTLKVGRSFVEQIVRDEHGRNLVGGIIQLARRLGLDVVAEGVETIEQRDLLRAESCPSMQGHLFGRALSADRFGAAAATPEGGRASLAAPAA